MQSPCTLNRHPHIHTSTHPHNHRYLFKHLQYKAVVNTCMFQCANNLLQCVHQILDSHLGDIALPLGVPLHAASSTHKKAFVFQHTGNCIGGDEACPWLQTMSLVTEHVPGYRPCPWLQNMSLVTDHVPGYRTCPWLQTMSLVTEHVPGYRPCPWLQNMPLVRTLDYNWTAVKCYLVTCTSF